MEYTFTLLPCLCTDLTSGLYSSSSGGVVIFLCVVYGRLGCIYSSLSVVSPSAVQLTSATPHSDNTPPFLRLLRFNIVFHEVIDNQTGSFFGNFLTNYLY